MRFFLFVIRLILPKNLGLLLLFGLNFFLMSLIGYAITRDWHSSATYIFAILYIIAMFLIFLPFGEFILRIKYKAQPISELGNIRIERLFKEVHQELRNKYKILVPAKVRMYFVNSDLINAYALGNKTIIISSELVTLSDDIIKAIFFHEMSHLIELDSYYNVSLSVGNIFIFLIFFSIKYLCLFFVIFAELVLRFILIALTGGDSENFEITKSVGELLDNIYKLWQILGQILCLWSGRHSEYKADLLAKKFGYGDALARFLNCLSDKNYFWFDRLYLTHPSNAARIERLLN